MKKYILIACGGMGGAMLRCLIEGLPTAALLPVNTLIINISGAFFMAFILTAALSAGTLDSGVRLGITTGFLGAFTTFSTMCGEAAGLIGGGNWLPAVIYIFASVLLGLGAAYFGLVMARMINMKLLGKEAKKAEVEAESDVK